MNKEWQIGRSFVDGFVLFIHHLKNGPKSTNVFLKEYINMIGKDRRWRPTFDVDT